MIEDIIKENTQVLKALLAALEANTEALNSGSAEPAPKKQKTPKKAEPAAPAATEPAASETPTEEDPGTPTKVEVAKTAPDDTPNVPAKTVDPGQPEAGEHVDVDEVISEINTLVKTALMNAADTDAKKKEWASIRQSYNVERVAELRGNPRALLEVLAKAKAF